VKGSTSPLAKGLFRGRVLGEQLAAMQLCKLMAVRTAADVTVPN